MEETHIHACSTSPEAVDSWIEQLADRAQRQGIEFTGPVPLPKTTLSDTVYFKRSMKLPMNARIRDIVDIEPPNDVYVSIGVNIEDNSSGSFRVIDVVPEEELPEGIAIDSEEPNESSSEEEGSIEEKESETIDSSPDDRSFTQVQGDSEESHSKEENSSEKSSSNGSQTEKLREQAQEDSVEEIPESSITTQQRTQEYNRSSAIRDYVKGRANGYCEGCGDPAPFTSKTGDPYFHAHHIHELSNGGSDTPETVVALCPNCHYRVHHGEDGEEYNQELLKIVQEKEE